MKKSIMAAAFAVAGLAAMSGSAFADLTFVGAQKIPDSFEMTLTANGGSVNVIQPFDRIVVTALGNVSFSVTGQTFNITNTQPFEDIGAHDVFTAFNYNGTNAANGWVQTAPGGTPGNVMSATATGALVTFPQTLTFKLNFAGELTDGTHFLVDFFQGGTYRTSYEVKFKQGSTTDSTAFGTEIVNVSIPLPPAVWSGLAMMAGLGIFLAKRRNDRKVLS